MLVQLEQNEHGGGGGLERCKVGLTSKSSKACLVGHSARGTFLGGASQQKKPRTTRVTAVEVIGFWTHSQPKFLMADGKYKSQL